MSFSSNSKILLIPILLCLCFLAALFYIHVNGNRYYITTYMEGKKGALVLDKKTGDVWQIIRFQRSMRKLNKEVPVKTTDKKTTVKKDSSRVRFFTTEEIDKLVEDHKRDRNKAQ